MCTPIEGALTASAEGGLVVIEGGGVAITITAQVAAKTADRLRRAAAAAIAIGSGGVVLRRSQMAHASLAANVMLLLMSALLIFALTRLAQLEVNNPSGRRCG